jgi:uncharacterized membrane protein
LFIHCRLDARTHARAQIYASAIYMVEYSRGLPNTWVLRGWWLLAFIFGAVRLQTVVVLIEDVCRQL